jgi:hypothetical protein
VALATAMFIFWPHAGNVTLIKYGSSIYHPDRIFKKILNLATKILKFALFLSFSHISGNVTLTKYEQSIYHSDRIFKEILNLAMEI